MDSLMKLSDIACQAERLADISEEPKRASQNISPAISATIPKVPEDAFAPRNFSISCTTKR
jgi:hypothetical protein